MKKEKNKFVFANGDSMNPVFSIDGTKLFNTEDVERKIEELEDEIRVTRGNANIAYSLNSFYERDIKKQKYKRCLAMADTLTWEHNYLVDFVSSDFPNVRFKRKHRIKWIKKWQELAEKFK